MIYARVPAIDGIPQVGYAKLLSGVSISTTEAVVAVDGPLQTGWTELTEAEYLALGGTLPAPAPSQDDRLTQLEQVVDTLLGGGA